MTEFGMFTDAGEDLIAEFVSLARRYALNDTSVQLALEALSLNEVFAESTDTVVRERVFTALNKVVL